MKARKSDPRNLDPNYLLRSEWVDSPFHTALLKFRSKFKERGIPCLHVDFHGKRDRKKSKQHRVDIGIQPFLEHSDAVNGWTGADVVAMRNVAKRELDSAFQGTTIRGKRVVSDPDPRLHGWWGDDDSDTGEECETTLTHASVLLNVPSMQLENPSSVRRLMMRESLAAEKSSEDCTLVERYAYAIAKMYEKVFAIEKAKGVGQRIPTPETKMNDKMLSWGDIDAAAAQRRKASVESERVCNFFFVYGSLRPDDMNGMPWRDSWLRGTVGTPVKAEIRGKMFDDTYAAVVLDSGNFNKNTVQGFLVEFPDSILKQKIVDGDEIEGCPDLYQRVKTSARILNGGWKECWVYVRANCNRKIQVESGDWVQYQRHLHKGKLARRRQRVVLTESAKLEARDREVQAFCDAGFPIYSGQSGSDGNVARMIDRMVADAVALDSPDPNRQV